MLGRPRSSPLFPHPTLSRSDGYAHHPYNFLHPPSHREPGRDNVTIGTLGRLRYALDHLRRADALVSPRAAAMPLYLTEFGYLDRKSTRLNSSHANISYAVFC